MALLHIYFIFLFFVRSEFLSNEIVPRHPKPSRSIDRRLFPFRIQLYIGAINIVSAYFLLFQRRRATICGRFCRHTQAHRRMSLRLMFAAPRIHPEMTERYFEAISFASFHPLISLETSTYVVPLKRAYFQFQNYL